MNKRFQDSFTSRVQLEYAFGFFSLVGWRPISLEKKKCEMMNKFLIRTSFFYPYSACSLSKVSI
jgi:hypothetical protein